MFKGPAIFVLALITSANIYGATERTFKGEIWDNICAKTGSHDAIMKKAGVNTSAKCAIGCAMTHGKYVLYNPSTKQVYQLDNQQQLLQFAGQKVQVKGTLEPSTSTIHVTNIALAQEEPKK